MRQLLFLKILVVYQTGFYSYRNSLQEFSFVVNHELPNFHGIKVKSTKDYFL